MRQRRLPAVITTLLISLALVCTATPAQAATRSYVALGDSFSSGVGARTYYKDGTQCYRSPKTFGALVAADYGLSLTLVACSGATTADVLRDQVSSLASSTRYVSLTIGGNDLGFSSAITECALPSWFSNCTRAVNGGLTVLRNQLPARIDTVLGTIRTRSPRAKVVVAGYPHLFNGDDCNLATFFSGSEMQRINTATDELNTLLRTKSSDAGMTYVDPVPNFSGHAVCDDPEWINGLSYPTVNSFHPNVAGYQAYARLMGPALVGPSLTRTTTDARTRPVITPAGTSTRSGPFRFRIPDLTTKSAQRAAEKAGISKAALQRLDAR